MQTSAKLKETAIYVYVNCLGETKMITVRLLVAKQGADEYARAVGKNGYYDYDPETTQMRYYPPHMIQLVTWHKERGVADGRE